ncbi:hypothetical protein [Stenotrophomonas sp. LM091]|uniref:hypothetical protein n=1 Tax=Stenotrophomonas sp. LM091 TaxID=1904944 RepID=UPI00156123EC|nr:hypothetical protein [Stenotrophomonas sp. LM091]
MDRSEHRKAATASRAAADGESFEVITREWLVGRPWVPAYGKKVIAWFEKDVFPYIGARRAGGGRDCFSAHHGVSVVGSSGQIRTGDLRVMSSARCLFFTLQ